MNYPSYNNYQDSGVEWLGQVPKRWDIKRLKQIAEFINGAPFNPAQWEESGIPIIRIQNLNGSEEFNHFNDTVDDKYLVKQGQLLFSWSGNRGTSFGPHLWNQEGIYVLNQHIFKVMATCDINIPWLYWTLKAVTTEVENQAHGIIGLVHITKGDLGIIKIPFLDKTEQEAIATFLNRETAKIDKLIAEQQRLIDLLKEKRKASIFAAVTGKIDVRELHKKEKKRVKMKLSSSKTRGSNRKMRL